MRSQLIIYYFSLLKFFVISPCPGLYPHPETCHQFYQCDLYQSYLFTCPQGTLFDSTLGLCNHEYLVSCSVSSSSSTSRPITQQTSNQPISSTSYVPTVSSTTSSWMPESSSSSGPSLISSTEISLDNEPINSSVDNEPSDSAWDNANTTSDSSNDWDELLTSTEISLPSPSTPSSGGYPTDEEDHLPNGESTTTDEENSSNSEADGENEENGGSNEEGTSFNEIEPLGSEEDTSPIEDGSSSSGNPSSSNGGNTADSGDDPSSSSSQSNVENEVSNGDSSSSGETSSTADSGLPQYTVSPTSLYPCVQPGYYSEESSCSEFYVCKEVAPGVLSAEKIFRCPDRYLFDPVTRLCQRQQKVECDNDMVTYYSGFELLVVKLQEQDLEKFFKQELTLPRTRSQTPVFQNIPWYPYPVQLFAPSFVPAYY